MGLVPAELPWPFHHVRTWEKTAVQEPGIKLSANSKPAGTLILDSLSSRTARNKFLLSVSCQSMIVYYSSLNGLRRSPRRLSALRGQVPSLLFSTISSSSA